MASNITIITVAFTHAKLDPIEGEPNYKSLKKLREQLGENAARIRTLGYYNETQCLSNIGRSYIRDTK